MCRRLLPTQLLLMVVQPLLGTLQFPVSEINIITVLAGYHGQMSYEDKERANDLWKPRQNQKTRLCRN